MKIMEEKSTKKRFVASLSLRQTIDFQGKEPSSKRRRLDNDVENNMRDSVSVSKGKNYHLLRKTDRIPMTNSNRERSNKKRMSIDIEGSVLPPSFAETKRSKRFSLFHDSKHTWNRYEDTSREKEYQTISVSAGNHYSKTIEAPFSKPQSNFATLAHSTKVNNKANKRRQLRNYEEVNNHLVLKPSKSKIAQF